jgi:putative nucleotidyltransferase with HDIG domain
VHVVAETRPKAHRRLRYPNWLLAPVGSKTVNWSHRWAVQLCEEALREDPARLSHCLAVGEASRAVARELGDVDSSLLAAAGVLHDIGYAAHLVQTGQHAIDGARYLASLGISEEIVSLVAHHSCATFEARIRGLSHLMGEFRPPRPAALDTLTFADMTTGPTGENVTVQERFRDIRFRHQPQSVTWQFLDTAATCLEHAANSVAGRRELVRQRQRIADAVR